MLRPRLHVVLGLGLLLLAAAAAAAAAAALPAANASSSASSQPAAPEAAEARAAEARAEAGLPVVQVRVCSMPGSFYHAMRAVVARVMQDLGLEPVCPYPDTASYHTLYPAVGAGDLDVLVAEWAPAHKSFYEPLGDTVRRVGVLASGAGFYLAVPGYVDTKEIGLNSIADLRKPAVMKALNHSITGIAGQSFLQRALEAAMSDEGYGLASAGYTMTPASGADFTASIVNGFADHAEFVFPSFAPSFFDTLPHIELADPKNLEGPTNTVYLLAHSRWGLSDYINTVLSRVDIGRAGVSEMDYDINVNKMNATAAALRWIEENRSLYDSWFRVNA